MLFGHHAEQAGLAYWEQKIATGAASAETLLSGIAGEAKTSNLEYMSSHYGNAYTPDIATTTIAQSTQTNISQLPGGLDVALQPKNIIAALTSWNSQEQDQSVVTPTAVVNAPPRAWM